MPTNHLEKEGLLKKRVNYFRVYQKFYVVLRDGRIDFLNEKTRELYSSIVLSEGFTVTDPYAHRGDDSRVGFSVVNGETILVRLMADNLAIGQEWKKAIDAAIAYDERRRQSSSRFIRRKRSQKLDAIPNAPEYMAQKAQIASKVGFEVVDNIAGMTVYRENSMTQKNMLLKAGCVINASVEDTFKLLTADEIEDDGWDEWEERNDILEESEANNSRIEHVRLYPVKVSGVWTKPRDMVLQRYWMSLSDGTRIVTWRSCDHPKAPEDSNYVRASIWMKGYLISPMKSSDKSSCWVDFMLHFAPGGWLERMPYSMHQAWAAPFISRLTILREAVERNRYLKVDNNALYGKIAAAMPNPAGGGLAKQRSKKFGTKYTTDGNATDEEEEEGEEPLGPIIGNFGAFTDMGNPLDKTPLKVRGKNYLVDRIKEEAHEAAFKYVACDLFETEGRVTNIASRPDNLTHRLVKEAGHPFIFVLHFTLPGPPFYSFVLYFAAKVDDMALGTPFGDLLNKFLNTDNDFRNQSFKLIPRVVDGSFIVKKAVGTTPAILGKKLPIDYFGDSETYFELVVDIGGSVVAGSILGVVKGYAKSLVIDLAFLLEGQAEEHLPEKLMGIVRLDHPDMSKSKKLPLVSGPMPEYKSKVVTIPDLKTNEPQVESPKPQELKKTD